jgi:signal transduction histidine kinase/ActR/RegA family two-component response regulator
VKEGLPRRGNVPPAGQPGGAGGDATRHPAPGGSDREDATAAIARLERRAARERVARREAEALLEAKSLELHDANLALTRLAESLEAQVEARTRQLEAAVEDARRATSAKTTFLATMSHELRTPMNGVIGAVQLLFHSALTPEQHDYAKTISDSGELLLSIINDILDLSKIEAGHLALEARPFDPRASLATVESLLRRGAVERGLRFQVQIDDAVPPLLVGDDMRLRQVLLNLASNAVKFTPHGAVTVQLKAQPPGADGMVPLELSVTDTGIGIARDQLETVFQPFTQAEASTAREYGGTGLGLAICRRIAALMQGVLEVRSTSGLGSEFQLRWRARAATVPAGVPAALAASAQPAGALASLEVIDGTPGAARPLRVLVAEDNAVNRTLACALLARLGLQAEVAHDGQAALEKVREGGFDIVLMDIQMPRMDGLEATRCIRALALASQPRVFALTANAFEEDRLACLAAGMDGFLAKPYRLDELAAAVADARALQSQRIA